MSCKLKKKFMKDNSSKEVSGKCPGMIIPSMNGDRVEQFEINEHPNDTLTTMNELRQNNLLCDVKINVEYNGKKNKFYAHKLVLASCSPYFKAMFTGGCKEKNMSEISMPGLHPEVFSKLLNFAYTSKIMISEKCVLYIMLGANMLQMEHVIQICCKFLESQLDPSNCIGLGSFLCELGLMDFRKKVEKYVCDNFEEVSTSEEFKSLERCQIAHIVSMDGLRVACESQVYKAVMNWVQHDPANRQIYLPSLLEAVRCQWLPPSFLSKQLEHCPVVNKQPKCKEYLSQIFKELSLHKPVKQPPRSLCQDEVIYIAGGYLGSSLTYMECFYPYEKKWFQLTDLPIPRSGISCCVAQGLFYAVGGRNNTSENSIDLATCDRYNPMLNRWDRRSSMNVSRNRGGIGVIDNMIYAVGGSCGVEHLNSVERYDPNADSWTLVSNMKTRRIGVGCAVVNRMLYAVGGFDGKHRLSSVEQYHPENDEWCFVKSMLTPRSGAGVVALNNQVYAIGGYDGQDQLNSVERYNVVDDTWQYMAHMKHRRSALAVSVHAGKIYALGGYDGDRFLDSVEVYDPTRKWKEILSMSSGRSGCGSAVGIRPCLASS